MALRERSSHATDPISQEWMWVSPTCQTDDNNNDQTLAGATTRHMRNLDIQSTPSAGEAAGDKGEEKLAADASYIQAGLLIPGKGKPSSNQAIVSENGKITYVGAIDDVPSKYSTLEVQTVPVLTPGLWECHAHFFGGSPNKPLDMQNITMTNPAEAGARNVRALHDTLYAGFTSCIDLGGYAPELKKVIDEGSILGPTLYGAGAALTMTAGHGEVFELPLGAVRQKLSVNAPGTDAGTVPVLIADGVDECRKAVRVNLRRGAKVIKVMTSGGATSLGDDPMLQQFSDEELRAIVEEARRMGLVCAAHAIGKAGITAAIRAGFKVIEHNSYADEEVLKEMKDKGIMLVATMTGFYCILENKDSIPKPMLEKVLKFAEKSKAMYREAIKMGIKCATGSDLMGGTALTPGKNGYEIPLAVEHGMTPLQAIEAATANGPLTLGPQAPRSGEIKIGFDADFIALEKNPLDDIWVFKKPKNITYIWKGGKLVKAPGCDSWELLGN